MRRYGFTGTQDGMTAAQKHTLALLIRNLAVEAFDLGDCVGADAEAYAIARRVRPDVWIVGHPPKNRSRRAFLEYDEERVPLGYLARNRFIAEDGVDGLLATPKQYPEIVRSGTWATVRYAQSYNRRIWVIRPDGNVDYRPARERQVS